MGAWIETSAVARYSNLIMSHPTWVRGLKPLRVIRNAMSTESHPTWVRGLKPSRVCTSLLGKTVASYVGAWIET